MRLKGAVFFTVDATDPFVAEAPSGHEVGPHIMPGVEHVIEYHVVTHGSCYGGLVGQPAARLETGDVIVFPQGDGHVMSSAPGMRAKRQEIVENAYQMRLPIAITHDGGGKERTKLVCGFLGCDARPFNPLLSALPRVLHMPRGAMTSAVVAPFVELAVAESTEGKPGGDSMLARLSELLFIEVVRNYLAALPDQQGGWLAGLRDDGVGRVLGRLHERPTHEWTLDELAREAGMSRSVLAERFAHFVGVPPMQYLAQWRMQLAATLLSTTALGLAEIAERVGYGSEAAFSRAYKRLVGVAPADWRRGKRSEASLSA